MNNISLKQCIIIGGGYSIKDGVDKNLWNMLDGRFTIGTNFSYKFFDSTILTFIDAGFYTAQRSNGLYKVPLIIGRKLAELDRLKLPNTILIKESNKFTRDCRNGIYCGSLCGIYALSLSIYLMGPNTEIFLLGYDFSGSDSKDNDGKDITHFYQGRIFHRGIGYTKYYNSVRSNKLFDHYSQINDVKIYNVSPKSKINTFDKISYDEFFDKLDNNHYDQDDIRKYVIYKTSVLQSYIK